MNKEASALILLALNIIAMFIWVNLNDIVFGFTIGLTFYSLVNLLSTFLCEDEENE